MTDNNMPSALLINMIERMAKLEEKIDQFFSAQTAIRSEMDVLKSDIAATKADVAEIKGRIKTATAYLAALSVAAGFVWMFVGDFIQAAVKKIFVQ